MLRRVETGDYYSGEVPLELFQGMIFKKRNYLEKALEIVLEGLDRLKVTKGEPIHICSGYILTRVRTELEKKGYKVLIVKIIGITQKLAEKEFKNSLVRLGVGDYNTIDGMRSFNTFLEWVLEDLENRERFVKTGWSSWPRLKTNNTRVN